ncbi:MAG: hypothetical protein R3F05_01900 [Planctomycetota bacterium]
MDRPTQSSTPAPPCFVRRSRLRAPIAACLLFLVALTNQPAASQDAIKALDDARSQLVRSLRTLANWASRRKLGAFRESVLELVLQREPDHAATRAELRYRRDRASGTWTRAPGYSHGVDRDRSYLAEAQQRLTAVYGEYGTAVVAALKSTPDLPADLRESLLEDLVIHLPDDPDVRRMLGDTMVDGRGCMPETVTAMQRRKELQEFVAERRPLVEKGITGESWSSGGFTGRRFRRRGQTVEEFPVAKFGRETLLFIGLGHQLTSKVLGTSIDIEFPEHLVLLPSEEEALRWMAAHPKRVSRDDLMHVEQVGALTLEDGTKLVYFAFEPSRRTTGLSSAIYTSYFVWQMMTDKRDADSNSWVMQGFSRRLAGYITPLKLPGSVTLSDTEMAPDEEDIVEAPESMEDWLAAGASVLRTNGPERLRRLMTVRTNAMRPSDEVLAYCLAAYLIEGRPDDVRPFLYACLGSKDADAMIREGLGIETPALARRLRRWLSEQR